MCFWVDVGAGSVDVFGWFKRVFLYFWRWLPKAVLVDRGRYFLIILADKPGHVAMKTASIAGINVEMTGLKYIFCYYITRFCLQSTFYISVLAEKCDGLVCRWVGTFVVLRGRMYKFLCGLDFPMRIGFPVFVYMVAADSSKVTMYPFLQSCRI